MICKILRDFRGSPDGCHVVDYIAGETADLTESLAVVVIKEGWAVAETGDAGAESAPKPDQQARPRRGRPPNAAH